MEVQSSLGIFEGHSGHLFFTYDQMALEENKYELAGKLIAWSVAHGGPGLKALDPCLYQLMCTQECQLVDFNCHLIPDADIQDKLKKVSIHFSINQFLLQLQDFLSFYLVFRFCHVKRRTTSIGCRESMVTGSVTVDFLEYSNLKFPSKMYQRFTPMQFDITYI